MTTDYTTDSILYGLKNAEFSELPAATKKKLIGLMARISEKSYRRGVQQGWYLTKNGVLVEDPFKWRFATLNTTKDVGDPRKISVIDRFYEQNQELTEIGLSRADIGKI